MSSYPIERAFPLTPLQQAMVLASVRDPVGGTYHAQCRVELLGELDPDMLARAWRRLVHRHPALRSFFAWEGREEPLQVVRAGASLPWRVLDWSDADAHERARRWEDLEKQDAAAPFDLTRAPIGRLTLVKFESRRHRLLWTLHHAVADGWSGWLIFREMLEEYEGLRRGDPPARPSPPSFSLFVSWLAARDRVAAREYWVRQLQGLRDASPLPAARLAPAGPRRDTVELELGRQLSTALTEAAARLRVTPYTLLLGAWSLVLDRHAPGGDAVAFATTVTERPAEIPGIDATVGMFLNTVPLRIPFPGGAGVGEWLGTVQRTAMEARHHGVGGLGEISRWAELEPGATLARSLVVWESFPEAVQALPRESSVQLADLRIDTPSDLPLTLLGHPGESVRLELVYDTALYTPESARRILRLTAQALAGLSDPAAGTVDALDVLGPEERQRLSAEWSRSPLPDPPAPDVLDAFDSVVASTPDAIAVKDGETSVRYSELDGLANRLAHRILGQGLGDDALVGIPAEPTVGTVASILACLKAGVGYVPFDPSQPRLRMERILAFVDRILVTGTGSPGDPGRGVPAVPSTDLDHEPCTPPQVHRRDDRIAYVIFTSGSTGQPKGVVVERGHLARSTAARVAWYDAPPRRFLLLSSLAVDSSVAGLYWTLCTGGCLILVPSRAEQDAEGLARRIQEESVATTLMVPSLWRMLLGEVQGTPFPALESVIVAGEACPPSLVVEHHGRVPGVRLVNEYGPSEATVWATAGELVPDLDASGVTIGGPVPFVRVYLLDPEGRLVPPGAPGEICLGGETVARGYLDPDHGVGRFVPDPFRPEGRMYRTGDRGRFRADGRLDFLGRVDDQLKIRGYRVEPGEIETVLDTAPGVLEAAVVHAAPTPSQELDALVARLLERGGPDPESLLTRLLEASPS